LIKNAGILTKNIYESKKVNHSMMEISLEESRIKHGKLHTVNGKKIKRNKMNQNYKRNETI